jgi:RNA polymerase sigma-70 factor, ECF subfamily
MTPASGACDKLFASFFLSQRRWSGVLVVVTEEAAESERAPERALVDRLRRGDPRAFDRVYATYHPRLFSFLLRLSGRRDTAEDLAQETWIKLAKAAPGLREDTTLAPYLFTIARNAFMSHRRWAMLDLSRLVTFGLEAMSSASTGTTPETDHERARAMALLEASLQQIPLASREVLLLVGVEGMEQDEVARVLGLSYDALRQRLSRARAQLTETMDRLEKKQSQRLPT